MDDPTGSGQMMRALGLVAVAACGVPASSPDAGPPADPLFVDAVTYAAGHDVMSVAVGDLDLDGRPDLAVVNGCDHGDSSVTVLRGVQAGTFGRPATFATGSCANAIAVADLDGDGFLDVITADESGTASVLLGRGSAVLAAPLPNRDIGFGTSVATGDLDGDGHLDIVTGGLRASEIAGVGDGTMHGVDTVNATSSPVSIALADFDGDGHLDVAIADLALSQGRYGDAVVLIGDGDGHFHTPAVFATFNSAQAIAAGDVDGDGHVDLVVAGWRADPTSVLFGRGDGTFEAPRSLGAFATDVAIADVTGDGLADIVVAGDGIAVVRNTCGRTFARPESYACDACGRLAVADVDGDGRPDVIGASVTIAEYGFTGGDGVRVLLHAP